MEGGLGGQTGKGLYYILSSLATAFEGLDSISESLARQVADLLFQLGDQRAIIDHLRETLTDEEREVLLTQRVSASPQAALEELLQLPGGEAALAALTALPEPAAPPAPPSEPKPEPPPAPGPEAPVKRKRGWQWAERKGGPRPLEECIALLRPRPKDVGLDVWAGCRRLLALRLELGMSQKAFAEQVVGADQSHYGALERGKCGPLLGYPGGRESPWSERAIQACEALGVRPEDVWQEIAPEPPHITWPTVGAYTARLSRGMEYLEDLDELASLWPALDGLPRHKEAVQRYYGINDLGPAILEEAGSYLGVTRERCRQLVKRGLEHMQALGSRPVRTDRPPEVRKSRRQELAETFKRLLECPSVKRRVWLQLPTQGRSAPGPKRLRKKRPIHRQDVGYPADKRKALEEVEVNTKSGLSLQQALTKLDKVWDLRRRFILGGMSGVIRSREEEELLRLAELKVGAAAPNPLSFPGMAEALIIFPYGNDYRPFPMGEDAWVDVRFLKEQAAELGFSTKPAPPFHIAFFWKGEGSCESS